MDLNSELLLYNLYCYVYENMDKFSDDADDANKREPEQRDAGVFIKIKSQSDKCSCSLREKTREPKYDVNTKFIVTQEYILKNIFPRLQYYSKPVVDSVIALMEKFRTVPDYQCILNVTGSEKYNVTVQTVINLIAEIFERGWLDE